LRILGEIPVRKFNPGFALPSQATKDGQPLDPDGNPDTSFLAKLPADQSFTFQLIDKNGMTLTAAQTWHQVRPGEARYNCGGCHAHSQQPTEFELTAAARPEYKIFDLTESTPLLTDKANDDSKQKWDSNDKTGLRYVDAPVFNVEYFRDIQPILKRSCVHCHTHKSAQPAGELVLDDDHLGTAPAFGHDSGPAVQVPNTYFRLAAWRRYTRPRVGEMVMPQAASRYVTKFQSRRSLLAWKIYGLRTDGYHNDDYPTISKVGDLASLQVKGRRLPDLDYNNEKALSDYIRRYVIDNDFSGSVMPPPDAVKSGKVKPLSDEDRRTIVRWIDLGCPIDIDPNYDPQDPSSRSHGWMGDDQRPTLTMTYPQVGENESVTRVLIGMADAYTGINMDSFSVTADFSVDGVAAGQELSSRFQQQSPGVWQWKLAKPISKLPSGTLSVSIKDHQGNVNTIRRRFSVK
jgi:hypothetical protein